MNKQIEKKYNKIKATLDDYVKIQELYAKNYSKSSSVDIAFSEREQAHEEYLCVMHIFSLFLSERTTKIIAKKMLNELF